MPAARSRSCCQDMPYRDAGTLLQSPCCSCRPSSSSCARSVLRHSALSTRRYVRVQAAQPLGQARNQLAQSRRSLGGLSSSTWCGEASATHTVRRHPSRDCPDNAATRRMLPAGRPSQQQSNREALASATTMNDSSRASTRPLPNCRLSIIFSTRPSAVRRNNAPVQVRSTMTPSAPHASGRRFTFISRRSPARASPLTRQKL